MKMRDSEWLTAAADLMYRIGENRRLQDAWYDFLLWASCQSGVRTEFSQMRQEKILEAYPKALHEKFYHLYRIIAYVVREKPRQNVPLRVMQAIHLAKRYTYNEQGARKLLLEEDQDPDDDTYRISFRDQNDQRSREDFIWSAEHLGVGWQQEFEDKIDNYLTFWNLGTVSLYDKSCAMSGGSRLIAAANVFQKNCPQEYRDRLFLIADDPRNRIFALMSFLQTALMGMACYVLTDDSFRVEMSGRLELFAPPTAICSLACFSTAWNDTRRQVLAAKDTDLPI